MGPARRRSIHGWPWSERLRLAYHRTSTETSTSKKRWRAFKNYVSNKGKTSLIRNKIRTSLKRVITSLGRLGLVGLRHRALHLHLLLPTRKKLTSIQVPFLLHLLPLKCSRLALLPSIRHHGLSGKQQQWVDRNNGLKALKEDKGKPMAT